MSCGVSHRRGSDLALLWLWCRPEATDIRPLAWKPPYAEGAALEKFKKKKKRKKERKVSLTVLEVGKSKIKEQARSLSAKSPLPSL